jgi:enoyl-CoA hydratase
VTSETDPSLSSCVHQERRGRVLVIRMEREAKRNAIDRSMTRGIDEALNLLEDDDQLWAGIITGTTAVFSAGTDLRDGAGRPTERGGEYGVIRRRRNKPLIAAVEGPAFGGGFEIALACDLVVASRTARFALPESRRGVMASSGALFRAMRALPLNVAKELLITGAVLDADRGYQLGFVNRVTDPGEMTSGKELPPSSKSGSRAGRDTDGDGRVDAVRLHPGRSRGS